MKKGLSIVLCVFIMLGIILLQPISYAADSVHHIYQQTDSRWASYPYGSGGTTTNNLKNKGCGVFATINAIEYLTGNFIDPQSFADWAMSSGQYASGQGSYWTIAKNSVKKYGQSYNYTLDKYYEFSAHVSVNSSSYPTTKSGMQTIWNELTTNLKAGETCVSLVQGHFIAIVDYNSESDKVLVYDSAAGDSRGTSSSASSSKNWKTMSELWYGSSEGKSKLKLLGMMTFFKRINEKYADIGDDFYACLYNPKSECQLTNSDNNVILNPTTNDANQLWHFERESDNGYKITSFVDGTCLDSEDGEYANDTNVQTFRDNGTEAQRWYFIDIGLGHYSIRTKLGNAYIDAYTPHGVIEPGTNIQLYTPQNSDAQVFCVDKVSDINSFLAHDEGSEFYANIFNTSTGYLLTNTDNNVTLDSQISSGTEASQIWKFEKQTDGSYVIRSAANNMCLDAEMGKAEDDTNVQVYEDNDTEAQKWVLCDTGNFSYIIKSVVGNSVIDARTSVGVINDGTNIQLYHPNGTAAQEYDIRVIDNISKVFAENIGTNFKGYIINSSTGYRLTNNNSNVTLDSETDNQNQVWRFERQEDNSYVIRSVVDDTCIDAAMGETDDDTNVQTYEYNGTEAQRWYFYKKGDNQYTIVSSKADKVIDARTHYGVIDNGTNIQLYHPNGTDAQIYSIHVKEEPTVLGDTDGDGEITISDATMLQRFLAELSIPTTEEQMMCGDVDNSGELEVSDATAIQRYLADMTIPYEIGKVI